MDEKITDSILFNRSIKEFDKLFKKILALERIIYLKNTFIYFLLYFDCSNLFSNLFVNVSDLLSS